MMVATRLRHVSLEEFLRLPGTEPASEYLDGVVRQKVSPQGKHATLQYAVAERFNRAGMRRKLFRAFPELRATFGGSSLVPDVAVYLWDRIPRDPDGTVANRFTAAPDVAVEIVSPEQSVNELVRKCLWYVANGVQAALLVDDGDTSILLFRPGHTPRAVRGGDLIAVDDVLPGVKITAKQLFDALR